MKTLIISVILALGLGAQTPNPNEQMVTVPKSWVQPEKQFQAQPPAQINQYIGIGKEIGEAVKNGLESVVDVSNKFADTPVGKFTLVMVAWKVMGRELLRVVLGLPLYFMGMAVWIWFIRRMYFGRWIKVVNEQGKKQRQFEKPMQFDTRDARAVMAVAMIVILMAWHVAMFNIIF